MVLQNINANLKDDIVLNGLASSLSKVISLSLSVLSVSVLSPVPIWVRAT